MYSSRTTGVKCFPGLTEPNLLFDLYLCYGPAPRWPPSRVILTVAAAAGRGESHTAAATLSPATHQNTHHNALTPGMDGWLVAGWSVGGLLRSPGPPALPSVSRSPVTRKAPQLGVVTARAQSKITLCCWDDSVGGRTSSLQPGCRQC